MARIRSRDNKRFVSDGFRHCARSSLRAAERVDSSPVLVAKVDSKNARRLATRPSSPGPQPRTRRLRVCATLRVCGGPGAESSAAGLRSRRNACGPELSPVTVQLKVCRTQENGNDAATQACQCAPVAETATMTPGRPGGSSPLMLARRQGQVIPVMVQSHRLWGGGT